MLFVIHKYTYPGEQQEDASKGVNHHVPAIYEFTQIQRNENHQIDTSTSRLINQVHSWLRNLQTQLTNSSSHCNVNSVANDLNRPIIGYQKGKNNKAIARVLAFTIGITTIGNKGCCNHGNAPPNGPTKKDLRSREYQDIKLERESQHSNYTTMRST